MLSWTTFNAMKATFTATITDPADKKAFADQSVEDKMARLTSLFPDAQSPVVGAFLLVYLVKTQQIKAGTPEHFELREKLVRSCPGQWHKDDPPADFFALCDENRTVTWAPEYKALGAIAAGLSHPEAQNPITIGYAILHKFGIGGLEDTDDPRSLTATKDGKFVNTTMGLLVQGVLHSLTIQRPEWFERGVIKKAVDEPRAKAELEEEASKALAEKKAAERAARREAAKAEQLVKYKALKAELFTKFDALAVPIPDVTFETIGGAAEALVAFLSAGLHGEEVDAEYLHDVAVQYIYEKVNQPSWFRRITNGDLVLRKQPLVEKPKPMLRKTKAITGALSKLINKYGMADVKALADKLFSGETQLNEDEGDGDGDSDEEPAAAPQPPALPPVF